MPGSFDDDEFVDLGAAADDSDEFVDAKETPGQSGAQTPAELEKDLQKLQVQDGKTQAPVTKPLNRPLQDEPFGKLPRDDKPQTTTPDAGDAALLTNPLDIFIHSGASMCFGLLLIILSMVPPAMSRLLSIIGFRGDRARGVRMLWSATRFRNVNGAVSGLVLLGYYNGLLGQADILPSASDGAFFKGKSDGREKDVIGIPRERGPHVMNPFDFSRANALENLPGQMM
ncbi:Inclusion body clearance protein iml2 like [Verticillium longisporum]|nr:Inclusion body clearance protein iml2 like [Verticillium longisporum]